MKLLTSIILPLSILAVSCSTRTDDRFRYGAVPATSFAKSVNDGKNKEFSVYETLSEKRLRDNNGEQHVHQVSNVNMHNSAENHRRFARDPYADPYADPTRANRASLWTDDSDAYGMFRDMRAFQPMDVITVMIRENNVGKKQADTSADSKYSISAGIASLFGLEKKVTSVAPGGFDNNALVGANTASKHDVTGATSRQGSLAGTISAVIMEVLPNGLMRIEGSKIISMNAEEEIMVISGLVRPRDINAENAIDSSRIANMRIDFYGKGVLGEIQEPGWMHGFLKRIMPF
jgi:flagellar L-ring protein precursor FlgH